MTLNRPLAISAMALALLFNMWIAMQVATDWVGPAGAMISVILFPITSIIMPIAMLFSPTSAFPMWAMWPAIAVIALIQKVAHPF